MSAIGAVKVKAPEIPVLEPNGSNFKRWKDRVISFMQFFNVLHLLTSLYSTSVSYLEAISKVKLKSDLTAVLSRIR